MAVGGDGPNIAGLARPDRRTEILAARKRAAQQSELTDLSDLVDDLIVWIDRLVPTGTFIMGGWDVDPIGFLILDGSTVTNGAVTYPQLATMFPGWVSGSDLVLPNMDGKTFIGNDAGPGVTGGSMTHMLSTAQLPSHSHTTPAHTHDAQLEHYGWALRSTGSGSATVGLAQETGGAWTGSGIRQNGSSGGGTSGLTGSGASVDHTPAHITVRVAVKT